MKIRIQNICVFAHFFIAQLTVWLFLLSSDQLVFFGGLMKWKESRKCVCCHRHRYFDCIQISWFSPNYCNLLSISLYSPSSSSPSFNFLFFFSPNQFINKHMGQKFVHNTRETGFSCRFRVDGWCAVHKTDEHIDGRNSELENREKQQSHTHTLRSIGCVYTEENSLTKYVYVNSSHIFT